MASVPDASASGAVAVDVAVDKKEEEPQSDTDTEPHSDSELELLHNSRAGAQALGRAYRALMGAASAYNLTLSDELDAHDFNVHATIVTCMTRTRRMCAHVNAFRAASCSDAVVWLPLENLPYSCGEF
jgi:hypothetical protein